LKETISQQDNIRKKEIEKVELINSILKEEVLKLKSERDNLRNKLDKEISEKKNILDSIQTQLDQSQIESKEKDVQIGTLNSNYISLKKSTRFN